MTAQNKEEFEKRIDAKAVPENAVEAIQPFLKEAKRIRWYHEYDGDKESFECKFKKFGYWFSVEFDKEGLLEDVEIKIKYHTLPHDIKEKISGYFIKEYDRWKIEKVQQQFTSLESLKSKPNPLLKSFLEIIVATKQDGSIKKYEYLFDAEGNVITKRKVIRQSHDFLLF
tara:strand:- start:208 stop:717 length:510 start_codon:yes stop_codon:yes gene_type:complete